MNKKETKWVFVVDTNCYAGNFERDMTAYLTGIIGECEVGKEFAAIYAEETGDVEGSLFEESIDHRPDEHGCHRPCSIYGNETNSVAIYFWKKPTKKQINLMKDRLNKFPEKFKSLEPDYLQKNTIKILGIRLVQEVLTRTQVKL